MFIFVIYYIGNQFEGNPIDPEYISNSSVGKFPINVDSKNAISIDKIGSSIILNTEKSLDIYSKNGVLINSFMHDYSNPVVVVKNSTIVLFDRGGRSFKVLSKNKILYESNIEERISQAYISDRGHIAFINYVDRYASSVLVYDSVFEKILTWYSSEYHITSLDFKSNSKGFAVSGVGFYDGRIDSIVYEIDFSKKVEVMSKKIEDTMIISINYDKKNNLSLIGNNMLLVLSSNFSELQKNLYNNKLSNFCYTDSSDIILYFENFSLENEFVLFNSQGKIINKYLLAEDILEFSNYDNGLVATSNKKILIFDNNFKISKEMDIENTVQKFQIIDSYIYILDKLKLDKLKMD